MDRRAWQATVHGVICPRGTLAPASPGQRSGKMRPSCARGASAGTGGGLLEPRNEWGGWGGRVRGACI